MLRSGGGPVQQPRGGGGPAALSDNAEGGAAREGSGARGAGSGCSAGTPRARAGAAAAAMRCATLRGPVGARVTGGGLSRQEGERQLMTMTINRVIFSRGANGGAAAPRASRSACESAPPSGVGSCSASQNLPPLAPSRRGPASVYRPGPPPSIVRARLCTEFGPASVRSSGPPRDRDGDARGVLAGRGRRGRTARCARGPCLPRGARPA